MQTKYSYQWLYILLRGLVPVLLLFCSFRAQAQYEVRNDSIIVMSEDDSVYLDLDELDDDDDTEEVAYSVKVQALQPVYKADSSALRTVPDSTVKRLQRDPDFAYANDSSYWKKEEPQASEEESNGFWDSVARVLSSGIVRIIFYALLIALGVFVLVRIIINNQLLISGQRRRDSRQVITQHLTDIEQDDLDGQIQAAWAQSDVRQAIRLMYLKSLRLLNDKELIRYHPEGTNYEYLQQVRGHAQEAGFRLLTNIYEYVWYGEFTLRGEQATLARNRFEEFYKAIGA